MSRDDAYLLDMLVAARRARRFVEGVTQEEFASSEVLQTAVVPMVQIIGEAAANVSQDTRERHPHIPWRSIVGIRNIVVHRYWDIDLTTIWAVVTDHIPALIAAIEPRIPPEGEA